MGKAIVIFKKIILTLVLTLLVTGLNILLHKFVDYRSLGMIYILAMNIYVLTFSLYNIFLGALLSSILWNFLFIPPRFTFHIDAKEDWLMQVMFFTVAIIVGKLSLDLKGKEAKLTSEYRRKNRFYNFFKFFTEIYSFKESRHQIEAFISEEFGGRIEVCAVFDEDIISKDLAGNWKKYNLSLDIENQGYLAVKLKNKDDSLNDEEESYIDFCVHQIKIEFERSALRDVSEKNKLLVESQKITNSLLSSVSHELRTPLSTIKGFASSLIGNKLQLSNEKLAEIGEEISVGVDRLDNVVQNLLDMSRIESGFIKLKKEGIDPLDLIQSAIMRIKLTFNTREYLIKNELQDYVEIEGDYAILRQCVENILRNASIYSEGVIVIFLKKINDHDIRLTIIDNGLGFKYPQQIFQKFYRERPEIPGGTGLGLSITKSFIELHGGKISAYNRNDGVRGAVIEIDLKIII